MVIAGDFKVQLVEAHTKKPFKEHTKDDGQTYVEAEPDVEYYISIQKLGIARSENLIARCLVDGKRTGWQRNYLAGATDAVPDYYGASDFEYGEGGNLIKETRNSLVFTKPTITTTSPTSTKPSLGESTLKDYGKVEFQLYEKGDQVVENDRRSKTSEIARSSKDGTPPTSSNNDDDSKHFFSEVGKKTEKFDKEDNGTYTTTYKRGELLQTITLYYCTVPRPRTVSPTPDSNTASSSSRQVHETVAIVSPENSPTVSSRKVLVDGSDRDDSPANDRKDNPEGDRVPPSPPGIPSLDGTETTKRVIFQQSGIDPPVVADDDFKPVSGHKFQGLAATSSSMVSVTPANDRSVATSEGKREKLPSPPGLGGKKGMNPAAQQYQRPSKMFTNSAAPPPPQRGRNQAGMPTGVPHQSIIGLNPQSTHHFFEGPAPNGTMNPHHHHHHHPNGMRPPVQFQQGPSPMNVAGPSVYDHAISQGIWKTNLMSGAPQQGGAPGMFNGSHLPLQRFDQGPQFGNGFAPPMNVFQPGPFLMGPPPPSFGGGPPIPGQQDGYRPNHPGNHHQFGENGVTGMTGEHGAAMAARGGTPQGAGIAAPGGSGYGRVGYVATDMLGGGNNIMGGHSPHPVGCWDGDENIPPSRSSHHRYPRYPKQGRTGRYFRK